MFCFYLMWIFTISIYNEKIELQDLSHEYTSFWEFLTLQLFIPSLDGKTLPFDICQSSNDSTNLYNFFVEVYTKNINERSDIDRL